MALFVFWEQRKLGEVAAFNPKDELPDEFEYVDLESVVGTEMLFHRTEKRKTAPSRAQRLARKGDLFYQTVRPYQKNNCLFEKSDNNYVFSTGYTQMRPYIDGYFLLSLVQSEQFVGVVLNNCTGTSYPAISSVDLAETEVYSPKEEHEHRQIGAFFRSLDAIITLHQRNKTSTHLRHASTLEQNRNAWEQRKLIDVAEKVTEKNTTRLYTETFTNSAEHGVVSQRDFFDHDVSKAGSINGYYVVRENDFVYNPRISTTAPCGPINCNRLGRAGVISPLYTVFRTHDIDTYFLEWYFKSSSWHSFMYFNGDTGARSDRFSIKNELFFSMPIHVPTMREQQKISKTLIHLDALITLHQRKP